MSILLTISCALVALFLFLYVCSKLRIFEKLLSSHFIFDPKELNIIVKKAVKKYPNDYRVVISDVKQHGKDEKTICTITHGSGGSEEEKKWIRETPDMDGKFNECEENPNAIFELRCQEILRLLNEKYPKYCSDMSTMDFFNSEKMKKQWMFNMCGVG
jgi:hypothetical protein